MSGVTLPPAELARLERLAQVLGATPASVLPFVLRDGFAETERVARAVARSRVAVRAGETLSHEDALARLDAMLMRNAPPQAT